MEDVDFMKQNSIKQNYVFLVDSKDRDRALWPTPSEYAVHFTTPFHNVIGMEVLDAQVPRTMYNVDVFNNTLTFAIRGAPEASPAWTTVTVDAGDYTIQTLVPVLNAALVAHVDGNDARPIAAITAATVSNPPDVVSKLAFTCPYPFTFDMSRSSIAETLGFDLYATALDADMYVGTANAPRLFSSVDRPLPALGPTRTLFEGPRGVLYKQAFTSSAWVAQRFDAPIDGYLAAIDVALVRPVGNADDTVVQWSVYAGTSAGPNLAAPVASGAIGISAIDGTLSDATMPATPAALAGNAIYWLVLSQDAGDEREVAVYYNDVRATTSTFYKRSGPSWVPAVDAAGIYYNMSATVTMASGYHRIEAPGLYSLVGERYATLRCPEIEDNSFRSLAYSRHNMGLGKIRLGVVGFSENRLDYNRIALREFHPIGKLARITIRFEAGNGQLYDFKGVNHTIVMVVHYYQGVQHKAFVESVLNPNYKSDFVEYLVHQEDQEEESDDQSIDYNEDGEAFARWQLNQMRNMPEQRRQQDIEFLQSLKLDGEDGDGAGDTA